MDNSSKKPGRKRWLVIFALIAAAAVALFFYPLRSYLVMSVYSRYNYKTSVMRRQGFDIDIKGGLYTPGKDWYPFVNCYDTSYEFSRHTGEDLSLTVLYNFGAFGSRSSAFYDESSDYFAAFYGAYALHDNQAPDRAYGFDGEEINIAEIAEVPMFDYKYLVIEDLGCAYPVFEIERYETEDVAKYAGYENWVKVDAEMKANSPSHTRREKKLGYIQYGPPISNGKDDFYEITLYGRMYARYFEEYQSTIVIYVMGVDEGMIDDCDSEILSATKIHDKR
jgi:hypothetical protein